MDDRPSLFKYLCERNRRLENSLTDGLGYLLKTRKWARRVVEDLLAERGATQPSGDFDCETQYQFEHGPRPDLALSRVRNESIFALFELKINAVLTPNQPEGYLDCLLRARPSGSIGDEIILFIVPSTRLRELWKEITAKLSRGRPLAVTGTLRLEVNGVIVSAIAWNQFLRALESPTEVDPEAQEIISIMKIKAETPTPEILAVNPTLIADHSFASEVLHYMQLAEKINRELQGTADETLNVLAPHKKTEHGYTFAGEYYSLYGFKWFWIGFSVQDWADHGMSPIWIVIENGKPSDTDIAKLEPSFSSMIRNKEAFLDTAIKIPIKLRGGRSGDELVTDALKQISTVVTLIRPLA